MDITGFTNAVKFAKEAIELLRQAKDTMPSGPKKEAAERALAQADTNFRIAEAQAAQGLDYPICKCSWPPQIMTAVEPPYKFKCGKCGYTEDKTPHSGSWGSDPLIE